MKLRKLFLTILLTVTTATYAAPVRFMPVSRIQPKGDTLHCYVSGDEYFHRLHDAEDYTIVQNVETGQYVYAALAADGTALVPTEYVPGRVNPASVGLRPGLIPDSRTLAQMYRRWEVPEEKKLPTAAPKSGTASNTLNNIVIFVRFSDESALTTEPFSTIDGMFNDSSAAAVSMYNFFKRSSYDRIHIPTYFFPAPSGTTVLSYQDSHPRSYYEPYSATNPNGYVNDDTSRIREFTMLENAVNWINTNHPVPTSINLDRDNDGKVDNICFVVSGTYTGWSDLLWPHKWSLYDRTVNINGKRVYTFNLQLAGSGSHYFSVSTFCHEMTHTLGCPDIYHYNNYTNVSPGGSWDLMNSNQTPPQQTNSFFKFHYLGWIDSIPELTDTGDYTLQSLASGPNHACKIRSSNPHQWYILEYRNNTDTFDSSIPNRGLLIWRFNDIGNADNASFNATTVPNQLWLFRPNSSDDTTAGNVAQASFGVNTRTEFSRTSNPHPYLCDGTLDTSFSITNIQISSDYRTVSFTFTPRGGSACGTMTTFPQIQNFDQGDEGCWTFASADAANDSKAGVYSATSRVPAHSGNYYYRFSSYSRASDYNQYLISPRLGSSNDMRMRFYYRKYHLGNNEQFAVKYSTTTNQPAAFTHTVTSITTTDTLFQLCDVIIPDSAKYVAINYFSNYMYYLYVDDIELRDTLLVSHDTVYVNIHDTLTRFVHDTLTLQAHDTLYYTPVDTLTRPIYDTVYQTHEFYDLTVVPNELALGTVSGSGRFAEGTEVEIAAMAAANCRFSHWQDNNTDNPRRVTVGGMQTYTAYFLPQGAKTVAEPPAYIRIVHDTVVTRDTIWIEVHDTTWITLRDTLRIPNNLHDTLWVDVHETVTLDTVEYYELTVRSNDTTRGFAAGSGRFMVGTVVELGAVACQEYHFVKWSDEATDLPYAVTVTGNMTLTALFEEDGSSAIVTAEPAPWRIYPVQGTLVVERAQGEPMAVYNVLGQKVYATDRCTQRTVTSVLPQGLYMVRIGTSEAQKVMVLY